MTAVNHDIYRYYNIYWSIISQWSDTGNWFRDNNWALLWIQFRVGILVLRFTRCNMQLVLWEHWAVHMSKSKMRLSFIVLSLS